MKISASKCMGLLACAVVSFSQPIYAAAISTVAPAFQELNADEQKLLANGTPVVNFKDDPSSAWPKAYLYYYVKATPEEAAAVFADYVRHQGFFPDCKESTIVKRVDRATTEVRYTVKLPWVPWPFNTETYTVYDKLSAYDIANDPEADSGRSYRIDWTLKEETGKTKSLEGNIRFEPFEKGTLLAYYNFAIPNSVLAGGFVGTAKEKVQGVVAAIAAQIEEQAMSDRGLLEEQVKKLRDALKSEPLTREELDSFQNESDGGSSWF
jgi:hypothetical protein